MDKRKLNRITAVFLTLLVLVVAFMLSGSFRRTSRVVLPQESQQDEQISGFPGDSTDVLTVVAVAPDTVQAAIETLARPEQYRQTVSVQQFWSGGNGTSETTAAVLTPWSRLDRQLADGRQRHVLTDGETTYLWYNSEQSVLRVSAGSISADMEQSIPTYEDVLQLPVETIAAADYRTIGDQVNCIYVETAADEAGYTLRYWVSVDTGLLVAAEKLSGKETVYRMWQTAIDLVPVFTDEFTLPDGTVLAEP